MKRKHKDAMIAMGIKISALEHLFKMHGQAHMAQDLLPQFTNLCKRVEEIEKRMVQIDIHRDRLANHDESIEALSETVDQLSSCKSCHNLAALEEDRKRIIELEKDVKDQREDYHTHFRGLRGDEIKTLFENIHKLVRDVDALQIRLSRAQDMIAEMQRDSRIMKSPGYKKEVAAQKQDAKSKKAK